MLPTTKSLKLDSLVPLLSPMFSKKKKMPTPKTQITDAKWKGKKTDLATAKGFKNSSSRGIKSTPRPFSASPPSPFCRLTCLIDHAFSPHCRAVISTMYIFGTPILEAFDLQTERNKVMGRGR